MSDCPFCSYIDACGCSLLHSVSHVKEEHPDRIDEFKEMLVDELVNGAVGAMFWPSGKPSRTEAEDYISCL